MARRSTSNRGRWTPAICGLWGTRLRTSRTRYAPARQDWPPRTALGARTHKTHCVLRRPLERHTISVRHSRREMVPTSSPQGHSTTQTVPQMQCVTPRSPEPSFASFALVCLVRCRSLLQPVTPQLSLSSSHKLRQDTQTRNRAAQRGHTAAGNLARTKQDRRAYYSQINRPCCVSAHLQGDCDVIVDLLRNLEEARHLDYKMMSGKQRTSVRRHTPARAHTHAHTFTEASSLSPEQCKVQAPPLASSRGAPNIGPVHTHRHPKRRVWLVCCRAQAAMQQITETRMAQAGAHRDLLRRTARRLRAGATALRLAAEQDNHFHSQVRHTRTHTHTNTHTHTLASQ